MSDEDELTWAEEDALAERDAANVELHRMHTEWLAARAERDTAQAAEEVATLLLRSTKDALGLASEEVRELRVEVARLTEANNRLMDIERQARRFMAYGYYFAGSGTYTTRYYDELRAALSPASTSSGPGSSLVRGIFEPETEGR